MKQIATGFSILFFGTMLMAGIDETELYTVKSGKIEYSVNGFGEIMGQRIETTGTKSVIFDKYGLENLTEEKKVDKQSIMGEKQIDTVHSITYMNGETLYRVDFKNRRITRMENLDVKMAGRMVGNKNMTQTGLKMMRQMGGKRTGREKILGYTCDVWELIGTKQCIYQGVPLLIESNILGIHNREIATKATFGLKLSKRDFQLPDFPVYDIYGKKLDKNTLESLNKKIEMDKAKAMAEMNRLLSTAAKELGVKKYKE